MDSSTETPCVLEGRVTRVLFRDEDALFSAVKVLPDAGPEVTVVGEFLSVSKGDEFTFTGEWETHPKWGPQLRVLHALPKLPREPRAIEGYLSGGLFRGVGKALARRLVKHFGERTLEVILARPEDVEQVPGISSKKRSSLVKSLYEHRQVQDLALFLQGHGVSLYLTKKIHEHFGRDALAVMRADPYRCAREIPGIGFLKADSIARKTGLPPDSPARVRASIEYVLRDRCEVRGHSFLPRKDLVRECLGFLNGELGSRDVPPDQVSGEIGELLSAGALVAEGPDAIYLREAYEAETVLAGRIRDLQRTPLPVPPRLEEALAKAECEAGITYAPEQREAIRKALSSPAAIVTGGPGTGKSTVIRGVIAALSSLSDGAKVLLAAPTGRAAKRMAEITGCEALTIHRLLEFSPDTWTFQRDENEPLDADLLVVDEASMLDLLLASALFRAVPPGMQVLLVGDADQLPSVGFGNVFADLIRSGAVPLVRLSHVFRQARESRIVTNAHRVNQGRMPILERTPDFRFVALEDNAKVAEFIRDAALYYRSHGMAPDEINVLTPMRRTETGVVALNKLLQDALNPPAGGKTQIEAGEAVLREGDKVMQIRNNYVKEVFNGDMGIVETIGAREDSGDEDEDERIIVNYQGARVTYAKTELDQLVLAYACTIHKAQGSEYEGVVLIPIVRQHWIMLQRNLLYTAITRARKRVVLVGQEAAIRRAVTNAGSRRRYSRLAERVRETMSMSE
ncbi:MAG TPA: ATP-dependent RecD-like DNA helicase [Thermoanaerobaculia bacterium]|jgi:exodeoxyribonuclease V alpha subunit